MPKELQTPFVDLGSHQALSGASQRNELDEAGVLSKQ
jgi:hypothetical protein